MGDMGDMGDIGDSIRPENSLSPSLSRSGEPETGHMQPHITGQRGNLADRDHSNDSNDTYDSIAASSFTDGLETNATSGDCEKMVEKWRLIRRADKLRPRKKIYPTHGVYTTLFGENYSGFFDAFEQGIRTPQALRTTATSVPAKRSAAAPKQASKRRRRNDHVFLQRSNHQEAPTTPDPQSTVTATKATMGTKPNEVTSPPSVTRESQSNPIPRPNSEAKEQPSRRKGVGIYAGNWEYVTDEEKVPEYLSLAQETAALQGRTTRRAYAKMTSKDGAGDFDRLVDLSSGKQVRKSGRARNAVDYTKVSGSEHNGREVATPMQAEGRDTLSAPKVTRISISTSDSSTPTRSAVMPNRPSRSISTATIVNTGQPVRPKSSWNAIVYEVLATSETVLTFPQLVQGVKDRFPFFKSPSQEKLLESGVKNPLYFHEAFCKGEIVNGKQTWGLKPGEWVDKKTGQVLTPPPRHTISSPKLTKQAYETEDQSPVDVASKSSQSSAPHNPRSSNPRFGRDILNSPEIPDSQDAKATTSSLQEADTRTTTEHASPPEHLSQQTSASIQYPAHELAYAADTTPAVAFVETGVSGQAPQKPLQWVNTTGSPTNTNSSRESPTAAGTKIQSTQDRLGSIDHEAPATAAQLLTTLPAVQPRAYFNPLSTGENGHGSSSTTTQVESTAVPPIHAVSPTAVPTLLEDCAATSQSPSIISAAPTPSVTPLAYIQIDGSLPDAKAGAKEMQPCTCEDGS